MSEDTHKIWVKVKGQRFLVEVSDLDQRPIVAVVEGSRFEVYPDLDPDDSEPKPDFQEVLNHPEKGTTHSIPGQTICEVISPMPGDISKIHVKAGQSVQPGDPLCVLDAMKMKNTIHAPQAGRIAEVCVKEGQSVEYGAELFRFN